MYHAYNVSVHFIRIFIWAFIIFLSLTQPTLATEQIRVGVYDNPPKVFTTPDGFSTGLYPQLLNSVADERGWSIEYVNGTWQECLDRLKAGKIDLVVDIAKTSEREKIFDFTTEPVVTNWGVVYARKQFPINSFQDMKNKSIAVVKGSVHTDGLHGIRDLMSKFNIPCRFVEVDSYRHALMLVDAAQVDGCVVNRLFGTLYASDYDISPTPIMFGPRVLLFAGQKGTERSKRLLRQIDQSLKHMKEDMNSTYHKDMAYYLSGGRLKWEEMQKKHLKDLNLSKTEAAWLKAHPIIRIGIDTDFEPFEFLSEDGEYKGIAADYLALLTKKTGLKFKLVQFNSWPETVKAAETRKIDMLPCVGRSIKRSRFLAFTNTFMKFSRVVITRIESQIDKKSGISAFRNLKVGVQKHSSNHAFLKERSTITPILYDTLTGAMMALSSGKIDAIVGNLAVASHLMKSLSLTNLKFAAYAEPEPQSLCSGVRKDWPELQSILDSALSSITFKEKSRILQKWFPLPTDAHSGLNLTQEEREWLLMNPRVRVAWDREWAPLEFADSHGNPQGISMDYLSAIGKMLGIEFDMGKDIGWLATSAKVKQREIDMFSCVSITPDRLKHLNFTDTYLAVPVVIFGTDKTPYVRAIAELKDKKIAVIKGYATDSWVSRDFPKFNIIKPQTIKDAFRLLKEEKIDAFIGNVLPGNYYLSQLKSHEIKIIGETPYKHKLRMAVRNDWSHFTHILQKALNILPEVEKTYFYRKWVKIKYENGFDYALFKKVMLGILFITIAFIVWNRSMAKEIKRRKIIAAELTRSESELRERNIKLKEMELLKDNLANMVAHDMRSPLMGIGSMLQILSIKLEKLTPEVDINRYLLSARNGVETMNRMVQSFLDVFKLESKELVLNCIESDLYEVASRTTIEMQTLAQMYEQQLTLSGKASVGNFDAELIRRVFTNLIENAFKANSKGGHVEVHTSYDDFNIIAEVKDNGPGIPTQHQKNIFDKFYSVEKDNTKEIASYGLGLAFCKMAIEAHKGHIEVESTKDTGSIFRITIPKI